MDMGDQYIKMCRSATEIQKCCKGVEGDYFYYIRDKYTFIMCEECAEIHWPLNVENAKDTNKFIWLPRQDQLQEIYINEFKKKGKTITLQNLICSFLETIYFYTDTLSKSPTIKKFKTMEQLWLFFVMCICYNKLYTTSDEWINYK